MPFTLIKDEETGTETKSWVAPKPKEDITEINEGIEPSDNDKDEVIIADQEKVKEIDKTQTEENLATESNVNKIISRNKADDMGVLTPGGTKNPNFSFDNFAHNFTRIIGQEVYTDFLGIGTKGAGDMGMNKYLDPNNRIHNVYYGKKSESHPLDITPDQGHDYFSVKNDSQWIKEASTGKVYSLKTGYLAPSYKTDKESLLKPEGPLAYLKASLYADYAPRLNKAQLEKLKANPENTIVPHFAITKVDLIRQAIENHNLISADEDKIGPTGDLGMAENRPLGWPFNKLGESWVSESGTLEERTDLKHGEGALSVVAAYAGITAGIALTEKRLLKEFPILAAPGRGLMDMTKNSKFLSVKGLFPRIIKEASEYAIPGHLADYSLEADKANLANFFIDNKWVGSRYLEPLAIDTTDTNATRREKNASIGTIMGTILGPTIGVPLAATKGMRTDVSKFIKKAPQIASQVEDEGVRRLSNALIDILDLDAATLQEQKAIELAQQGPTTNTTKKVTGGTPPKKTEIITPKETQEELDIQQQQATIRREKAEVKAEKSTTELLQPSQTEEPKLPTKQTDTRGQGVYYHGAANKFELVEGGQHATDQNIYGPGFYTTEDLTTAGKYQKKNRKSAGKDATQVVYKINEKQPVKFYDLDQPVSNDLKEFIENYDDEFAYNIVVESVDSLGDNYTLGQLYDEIRGYANANDVSASVVSYEIFPDFEAYLKNQGFGGFTHQGGKKAGKGKRLHQVKIYWEPYEQVTLTPLENLSKKELVTKTKKLLSTFDETKFRKAQEGKGLSEQEINERANYLKRLAQNEDVSSEVNLFPLGDDGPIDEYEAILRKIERLSEKHPELLGVIEGIVKEAEAETARISGMEVKPKAAIRAKLGRKQALEYGDPSLEGRVTRPTGQFHSVKQLIYISLTDNGILRNRAGILDTVWHENMHALQDYFYTPTQKKLLAANRKKLKQIALEGLPERASQINKFNDSAYSGVDEKTDRELQAFAFAAWRELGAKYEKATWAEPFRKMQQILTKVGNALRGYGYNTLEDLLADSGSGNIRQRALKTKRANTGISFELDPEDLIKRQDAWRDAVDKGDMSIDKAMESMTRRLVSRTGKTTYLPRTSDQLIYANASLDELLREMLGDRETLTGLKSYKIAPLLEKAKAQLKADGLDPKLTLQRFEQAAKGDLRSQEDLIAMTGLLAHHDINLRTLSENSIEFRSAKNATDKLNAGKKMLASFEDHIVLSTGWAFSTRNASQRLKLGQISFTDSVNETIPPSTIFRQNVESDLVSDSILKDGFTTTDGIAGQGVYFTTDSTPGNVEINGPLPADIPILNLAGSNKSITDLLIELKLGKPKKAKDGVTLTPKQQEAIKNYAENKGYKGIRYATDFTSKPQSGDQVVIFDPNDANRIVRSAAAIPPEKVDTEPVSSLIEQAIRNTTKIIENKLPQGAREALKEGRMTPELLRILDAMSALAYELNDPQSLTRSPITNVVELINDVPKGKLTEEAWYDIWRNWLFLSASTMMKVFGGTEFRALTLPVGQWLGEARLQKDLFLNKELSKQGSEGLGTDFKMSMSKVRQRLYLSQYSKYFQQLPYAIRMAYSALKHNEVFVNLGRGEFDEFRKNYSDNTNQLELDFNPQTITEDPVTLTGKEWWLDSSSNALSLMWRHGISEPLRTGAGRLLASIDSFHSGMVGPTSEFTRLMEMNIAEIAMRDNLNPETHFQEIYESAFEKTNLQLKKLFAHVRLKDGTMIEKGRLKGQHAKNVMDWVQFTDDISVKNEARTFEYGVRAAKEEGLTDKREIFERALTWVKEGEQFERYGTGDKLGRTTFGGAMADTINLPGEIWQTIINKTPWKMAYVFQATNRTPVNMTKSALRITPGLNNYVDSYWRDIHSQDYSTRAKALGEVAVAQSFLGMATVLGAAGVVQISGPLPVDQKKRNEWREVGKQPESIRFKLPWNGEYTRWFPTDTFEQFRIILTAAGAYTDVLEDCNQKESDAWFGYCALTSVAPAISKTGLNTFQRDVTGGFRKLGTLIEWFNSEITDELKGDQNKLEKFILQFLTGTGGLGGPAVVKAARYSIDPYERDYDIGSNSLATAYNMWKRNIPYLSKTAPPVLNSYTGNPIPAARVPGSMLIDEESAFIKGIHDQMTPLAALRGRHQSTDPIDEERLRMGSNRLLFGRRSSGLPNRTLNRTELNRLIEIATKEVKLPYPPGSKTKPDPNGLTLPQALRKMITESVIYKSLPYENKKGIKSDRDKAWDLTEQRYKQLAMEYFIEEMDDGTPESLGYQLKLFKQQKEIKEKTRFSDYDMSINSLEDWKQLAQA